MAYTLQLLHLADGEAGLLAAQTAPILAALVDRFDDTYANTLILSGGDNFIPGPFLAAGTDSSLSALSAIGSTGFARPDTAIHNALGVEVSAIGNHEFDLGSNVFADSFRASGNWPGAQYALVTANLNFSGDSALRGVADATLGGTAGNAFAGMEASSVKARIAPWVTVTEGGEKIGLLGATTQRLASISSPSGTTVLGTPGNDDMALLASQLQPVINQMIAAGINKILLMAHLQNIANEQALASLLTGVDIILAAGSNTRLGDADDVAAEFPGHAANFAGTYPLQTTGADGNPVLIVNTDNEYTYLGRLVVDFDDNGVILPASINPALNGAYASTQQVLNTAYGTDIAQAFAAGSKGAQVQEITNTVQAVINAKDGAVSGFTNVYLEGERVFVRSQETNLGNLTADANLGALTGALGTDAATTFVASLKNGGGIRAQIGAVSSAGGSAEKLPPLANPAVGKAAGGVSQLDIENSLRFNNGLMAVDLSPEDLKAILEHGVAAGANQGRYPQIGGVRFSYDPNAAANARVSDIALIDQNGGIVAKVMDNGVVLPGAPAKITLVTLNFMANGGDGYPFKTLGENFRYLLTDGTLSAPVDPALNFTASDVVPANMLGEQAALQTYLQQRHSTAETAFAVADTDQANDTRIQNTDFRADTVLTLGATTRGTANADALTGTIGEDALFGFDGNDTLDGGPDPDGSVRDFLFGGAGNDTYIVRSSLTGPSDLVYEGPDLPGTAGGAGDVDTIRSAGQFFRDFYSVGEILIIDEQANLDHPAGTYIVGGAGMGPTEIFGNSGTNFILAYGGTNTVRPGAGNDSISFGLFDLPQSANGVNTLVLEPGTGRDFVYDFETGVDKVDLRAFSGLTAAGLLATGTDVAAAGGASGYSHFYLGESGGVYSYVAFVGLSAAQLSAGDFLFAA